MSNKRYALEALSQTLNKKDVKKYPKLAEDLRDHLTLLLTAVAHEAYQAKIDQEAKVYENETHEQFIERLQDPDQWIEEVRTGDEDKRDYVARCELFDTDDCYYGRHFPHRLSGCTLYRLKGSDEFFLCDYCVCENLEKYAERFS